VPFCRISFGQQRVDSSLAGILMGVMPLTTMALAHFFVRGERLNQTKASGFLIGFAGLMPLIGPQALLEVRGEGTELVYRLAILAGAERFGYDLSRSVAAIRPTYGFDETCDGAVPEALTSALEASDYEDAVRNAISLGGDADPLACIAGGIAEAMFGLPAAVAGRRGNARRTAA
jgi:ADP-ribosylglycohydrolase/EamA-like transporter family